MSLMDEKPIGGSTRNQTMRILKADLKVPGGVQSLSIGIIIIEMIESSICKSMFGHL